MLDFPPDLLTLQRDLYTARAQHHALCATLPWSVGPMPGWPGEQHPHTGAVTGGREDSPGWTPEQREQAAALLARARDLSIAVATHPHWDAYDGPELVAARMALKQHPDTQPAAGVTAVGV